MSVVVHATNIFLHFDKFLNPAKAKNLYSFCIARSICYIANLINGHSNCYRCDCFKCLVCRVLISMLPSRGHKSLLYIVNRKNYLYISNGDIFNCLNSQKTRIEPNY